MIVSRKKAYTPKREKYNDLSTLYNEMREAGIKILYFNGNILETKHQRWGLYEGRLTMWDL
jgi:hypothetical protein